MATYQNKKIHSSFKIPQKRLSKIQKLIISVIVILFLLVTLSLLFVFLNKPENLIKSKISSLASSYYENYLYEKIGKHSKTGSAAEVLKDYNETGLSSVYLSQLLLYDNQIDTETVKYLSNRCDENKTAVKFFPEPPYSKTSYHTEYFYTCDF